METIKVYFAINIKEFEKLIEDDLKRDAAVIGSATYQESVLNNLPQSGADVMVLMDSLSGNLDIYDFLFQIRIKAPSVRIILLTNRAGQKDPFLDYAVKLGIYDIINTKPLSYKEITSLVRNPNTFEAASQFYIKIEGASESEDVKHSSEEKGRFGFLKRKRGEESGNLTLEKGSEPQIDIKILKEAIYSEASKNISENYEKQITFLSKHSETLEKEIERLKSQLSSDLNQGNEKDKEISSLMMQNAELEKQITELKASLKTAETESEVFKESAFNELESLRAQIVELNSKNDTDDSLPAQIDIEIPGVSQVSADAEEIEKLRKENEALKSDSDILLRKHSECLKQLAGKQAEVNMLNQDVKELTKSINKKNQLIKTLNKERIALEEYKAACSAEFINKKQEYPEKTDEISLENQKLKNSLDNLNDELRSLKEDYSRLLLAKETAESDAEKLRITNAKLNEKLEKCEEDSELLPQIIYPESYQCEGSSYVYLFTGARRGMGTTTLALNYAASLAKKGEKTIFLEMDSKLPLAAGLFDILSIPFGIEEALSAIRSKNYARAEDSVIKLAVKSADKKHRSLYSKLPLDFHMMLYSDASIKSADSNSELINSVELGLLIDYLADDLGYKNIIFDVCADNYRLFTNLLKCGRVNRFVMNIKREGISVIGARDMINKISEAGQLALVRSGRFLIDFEWDSGYTNEDIALAIKAPKENFIELDVNRSIAIHAEKNGYLFALEENHTDIYKILSGLFA